MTLIKNNINDRSLLFSRIMYGTFVLLSIYFLSTKDIASAMSNLGIGLIFDPFDQKVSWQQRPVYQKMWLIIHVCVVFGLLAIVIINRFG